MDVGALGHLMKPLTRSDLQDAIEKIAHPVERVLVVDDDPMVLRLFERMLQTLVAGVEVITALCGEAALQLLRDEPVDLLLLDIGLPDMDGWQVVERVKMDSLIADLPATYFVSARDPSEEPPMSQYMVVALGNGFSLNKLLRCSLDVAILLMKPERELDLEPG